MSDIRSIFTQDKINNAPGVSRELIPGGSKRYNTCVKYAGKFLCCVDREVRGWSFSNILMHVFILLIESK